jgi:hypothetical protein
MSELFDWIQGQWYQLASVLIQLGILATLFFQARKALRLIGASKAHVEPRQDVVESYSLTGRPASINAEPEEPETHWHIGSHVSAACRRVGSWLQGPMGGGSARHVGRLRRWLQAPTGS